MPRPNRTQARQRQRGQNPQQQISDDEAMAWALQASLFDSTGACIKCGEAADGGDDELCSHCESRRVAIEQPEEEAPEPEPEPESVEETYWPTIEKYINDRSRRGRGPAVVVNCIICLSQVTVPYLQPQNGERERGAMLLPCQHIVGTNCGVTWVNESRQNLEEQRSKCPICRSDIRDVKQCLEPDEKIDRHNQIVKCGPSWK
ncbi:hypothetical protein B0T25DRAFT_627942 [Lasiosphaeria hispida]|uniref:RING-type domain-containing protein n=1 Tax=Lasiosphaeria hispida TaxID=260671 RepID=A0AAJ0HW87_9PEZI|nr:hypothetical protein B0T25DRAFT_627942 [Lasiosphaeria hispida]